MKKLFLYVLGIVIIAFAIPIILTTNNKTQEVVSENVEMEQNIENLVQEMSSIMDYDYNQYNNIKVLHAKTNEIEEMNIDEYLLRGSISRNAS